MKIDLVFLGFSCKIGETSGKLGVPIVSFLPLVIGERPDVFVYDVGLLPK